MTEYPGSDVECCLPTRPKGYIFPQEGRRFGLHEDGPGGRMGDPGQRLVDIVRDRGEVRGCGEVSQIYEWKLLVKIVLLGLTWRGPRPGEG